MALYSPSPNQSAIQTALRSFLLSILPAGDALFTGWIAGTALTVASIAQGSISLNDVVLGTGVGGTTIAGFGTGTGGTGTYTLSQPQNVGSAAAPVTMTTGMEILAGQANRVPEPAGEDFIIFTEIAQRRLATNVDTYADCAFTGSIAGNTLTVTAMQFGAIAVGNVVFGVNIAANTIITGMGTGSGGVGTYTASQVQALASGLLAAGVEHLSQATEVTFQIDVHGPNSSDAAQTISTMFRDDVATNFFQANGFTGISPLYADDPRQVPFVNAEQQFENRWIVDAVMQVDQVMTAPQQFAAAVSVGLIDAQQEYSA